MCTSPCYSCSGSSTSCTGCILGSVLTGSTCTAQPSITSGQYFIFATIQPSEAHASDQMYLTSGNLQRVASPYYSDSQSGTIFTFTCSGYSCTIGDVNGNAITAFQAGGSSINVLAMDSSASQYQRHWIFQQLGNDQACLIYGGNGQTATTMWFEWNGSSGLPSLFCGQVSAANLVTGQASFLIVPASCPAGQFHDPTNGFICGNCQAGTYNAQASGLYFECGTCATPCVTCTGGYSTTCATCASGYFLSGTTCSGTPNRIYLYHYLSSYDDTPIAFNFQSYNICPCSFLFALNRLCALSMQSCSCSYLWIRSVVLCSAVLK